MGTNRYTGQLVGPFQAKEDLLPRISNEAVATVRYLDHLGIQAPIGTIIFINDMEYQIGETGMYEIEELNINSLYFKNNINNAIVDYVIEI